MTSSNIYIQELRTLVTSARIFAVQPGTYNSEGTATLLFEFGAPSAPLQPQSLQLRQDFSPFIWQYGTHTGELLLKRALGFTQLSHDAAGDQMTLSNIFVQLGYVGHAK